MSDSKGLKAWRLSVVLYPMRLKANKEIQKAAKENKKESVVIRLIKRYDSIQRRIDIVERYL